MLRRKFVQAGLIATVWFAASAHTPYRQWQVYRQRHLLIGTSKADSPTYPLGQKIAEVLATHLPGAAPGSLAGPIPGASPACSPPASSRSPSYRPPTSPRCATAGRLLPRSGPRR